MMNPHQVSTQHRLPEANDSGRRVHILFVIFSLAVGGAQRVIVNLLQSLDRKKCRLTLILIGSSSQDLRHEVPEDVKTIELGYSRVATAMPTLIRHIWKLRPDTVFSTIGNLNIAVAISKYFLPPKTKLVARESTILSQSVKLEKNPLLSAGLYRKFYGKFDSIISQSESMKQDLVREFGISSDKITVIHNPMNVEEIQARAEQPALFPLVADGRKRLLAVGRLTYEKGYDILLEAMAKVSPERLHLTIVGEGLLRQEIETQIARLGLADRVVMAGFKANPYPYMKWADALVLSSRFEGFPNVVLESLACGTPVIATPAPGGLSDIVDHCRGVRVSKAVSAEALVELLDEIVNQPKRAPIINDLEPFFAKNIAQKYENVLLRAKAGLFK